MPPEIEPGEGCICGRNDGFIWRDVELSACGISRGLFGRPLGYVGLRLRKSWTGNGALEDTSSRMKPQNRMQVYEVGRAEERAWEHYIFRALLEFFPPPQGDFPYLSVLSQSK